MFRIFFKNSFFLFEWVMKFSQNWKMNTANWKMFILHLNVFIFIFISAANCCWLLTVRHFMIISVIQRNLIRVECNLKWIVFVCVFKIIIILLLKKCDFVVVRNVLYSIHMIYKMWNNKSLYYDHSEFFDLFLLFFEFRL